MSYCSSARLVYGFSITDQTLINNILGIEFEEDENGNEAKRILLGADLSTSTHGDNYDQPQNVIICINKSMVYICGYEQSFVIKQDKFVIKDDWNDKLKSWAKENNLKNIKIGWYLTSSYG